LSASFFRLRLGPERDERKAGDEEDNEDDLLHCANVPLGQIRCTLKTRKGGGQLRGLLCQTAMRKPIGGSMSGIFQEPMAIDTL
jgi:hypothetical protein